MERKQETEVQWFCKRKTGKKRIICVYIYVWIWHTHTTHQTTYTHFTHVCMYGEANEDNLAGFSTLCVRVCVVYIYDEEEKDT